MCVHRYEGENFVLDQQVVRAALKAYGAVTSRRLPLSALTPSTAYLRRLSSFSPSAQVAWDWTDPETSITLLEAGAPCCVSCSGSSSACYRPRCEHRPACCACSHRCICRCTCWQTRGGTRRPQCAGSEEVIPTCMCLSSLRVSPMIELCLQHLPTTVEQRLVDVLSFGLLGAVEVCCID